jgi:hypothetical protein
MAIQLFKDSEVAYIEPHDLQNHLDAGWSLDDPDAPKTLPAGIEIINQKAPEETIHEPKKRGRKPASK